MARCPSESTAKRPNQGQELVRGDRWEHAACKKSSALMAVISTLDLYTAKRCENSLASSQFQPWGMLSHRKQTLMGTQIARVVLVTALAGVGMGVCLPTSGEACVEAISLHLASKLFSALNSNASAPSHKLVLRVSAQCG